MVNARVRTTLRWGLLGVALMAAPMAHAIMARDYTRDLHTHQAELQQCFAVSTTTAATVQVRMDFGHDGRVADGQVLATDPRMNAVGQCILTGARRWVFQRSSSGARRSYEFRYVPGQPIAIVSIR